jgi:predicted lipoprotein with Yx(FWY)xxD motif
MKIRTAFIGIAALALVTGPALAEDFLGGLVKSTVVDGREILTGGPNGLTLYIFDRDTNANETTCYEQCAVNWPPLLAEAGAMAEGDFTLVARTDGTQMWAYKTKPLYYYIMDTAAGQQTGDGRGDVWHTALK